MALRATGYVTVVFLQVQFEIFQARFHNIAVSHSPLSQRWPSPGQILHRNQFALGGVPPRSLLGAYNAATTPWHLISSRSHRRTPRTSVASRSTHCCNDRIKINIPRPSCESYHHHYSLKSCTYYVLPQFLVETCIFFCSSAMHMLLGSFIVPRPGDIKRWCCLTSVCLTSVCLTSVAYIRSAGGVCGRLDGAYWLIGPGSAGLAQGCRCALPLQVWAGAYLGGRPPTICFLSAWLS